MNPELLELFNKLINKEFHISYQYFAMSTYFDEIMMQGFSLYMKHLASFELSLAQKMYDYLILRDEKLSFLKIDEPSSDWVDVSDIFKFALDEEKALVQDIEKLYHKAKNTDDIMAMEFVSNILNTKMKSLSKWKKLVYRIQNSKIIPRGVEFIDTIINKN
ncbi:hypothetical protein IJ531_05345 [bacterium]|nr:hypothetical protein [bacterium]